MDGSTFDRLTQFVGGSTRRFALRTALGGATVAAAGVLSGASSSEAKKDNRCKKKLKKCRKKGCPVCESLLVQEPCNTTSQCCGSETNMACAFANGIILGTVCCGTATAPCTDDADCCTNFTCVTEEGQCAVFVE